MITQKMLFLLLICFCIVVNTPVVLGAQTTFMSQETAQVVINAMEKTTRYRLIKRLIMQQKIQVPKCTSKDDLLMI